MSNILVRANLYVKIHVDEDSAYNLLDEAEKAYAKGELPIDDDLYGIRTLEDAVRKLALDEMIEGRFDIREWDFTPEL